MPRQPRLETLTFSLLKEGMAREDALRDIAGVSSYVVPAIDPRRESLFVSSIPPHPPRWQSFLAQHVSGSLEGLATASSAAVLMLESAGRLFAVTFGQGRHLLDTEAFEQDFGLKVVLNTVAPDQLKSVDARTIDETPVHTRRDVSRDSSLAAFGLDVSRDLLRAVTGTPWDDTLARRLTGATALGMNTRAQVPELPALASRLLEAYEADDYKAHFDFIDFLRPEKRPGRRRELEERLVTALIERDIEDVHLAAPEPLDWLDIDGFRFSTWPDDRECDNDPRISAYLATREGAELDADVLRRDRMLAIRASDGQPQAAWPLLRCIVYQVEVDDELYVLSAGDWYRINLDFKERVYQDARRLPIFGELPDADPGTDEESYNLKAAAAIDALCLDRKLVYDAGPDRMEICDVLTRDGRLIHIKHRGSSSTLSHLFSQGLNCAERLLQDEDFRRRAREVIEAENPEFADVLPLDRPDPQAYEVCFAVITRSNRDTPLTLPFFSVVSLRTAASRLQAFGFRVAVAAVRELAA